MIKSIYLGVSGGFYVQTLYIDVYFLINFTVDLLALYFAALFSKVQSTAPRLIISSLLSAAFACLFVLVDLKGVFVMLLIALQGILTSLIFAYRASLLRKTKLIISFLIFEALIGGLVSWFYNLMDKYLYPLMKENAPDEYNSKLLMLSLLVLLSYGIIKMLFIIFGSGGREENCELSICLFGKCETVSALVDSGNLLTDPMSNTPVILIKRKSVKLFSDYENISECDDIKVKTRIRIIPARSLGDEKIFTGIRCDYITLNKGNIKYNNAVVALDDEEGSYGGYSALMPSSLING